VDGCQARCGNIIGTSKHGRYSADARHGVAMDSGPAGSRHPHGTSTTQSVSHNPRELARRRRCFERVTEIDRRRIIILDSTLREFDF
jgi:hypothetical protein